MKSMKSYAKQAFAALALSCASVYAMATTITFDDLPSTIGELAIANGYAGFNWDQFYVLDGIQFGAGYANGVVSPSNVAYNGYERPASFSSATAFTLNSLYITKAWNVGNTHIEGYSGASLLYSVDVSSTTTAPTFVSLNWGGLTSVKFTTSGVGQTHSAIDNITINAVPEPETYAMMLAGLGILGFAARRKRTAA